MTSQPFRLINAVAPIRICDCGGWTDIWFAGHGNIFNIGVYPYIEVQVEVLARDAQAERISVFAAEPGTGWNHHPLIEAVIERMSVPNDSERRGRRRWLAHAAVWADLTHQARDGARD